MNTVLKRIAVLLLDVACVAASYCLALFARFGGDMSVYERASSKAIIAMLFFLVLALNTATRINRGFMRRSGVLECGSVLEYNAILIIGISVLTLLFRVEPNPSRLLLAYFFIFNTIIMCVARWAAKAAARAVFKDQRRGSPIVMIVSPSKRVEIEHRFRAGITYRIAGCLDIVNGQLSGTVGGRPITCPVEALPERLSASVKDGDQQVLDFFVCAPDEPEGMTGRIVDAVERYGTNCHVAVDMPDPAVQGARLDTFGEIPVVTYVGRGGAAYRVVVKRLLDIILSAIAIVVAFIPGAICALIIWSQSKGSPFYTQSRLGRGGKYFKLLKFRSMVSDADNVEKYFTPEQLEAWKTERKVDDDPRITKVGHFLRKTSLDEFPQFINVLLGDMSIVGPRPIVDDEIGHYGDRASEFLSIRPGVTGWWQVTARNDATYADGTRQELELYYVRHASFTLDWNIIKRTFGAVFGGTGK